MVTESCTNSGTCISWVFNKGGGRNFTLSYAACVHRKGTHTNASSVLGLGTFAGLALAHE